MLLPLQIRVAGAFAHVTHTVVVQSVGAEPVQTLQQRRILRIALCVAHLGDLCIASAHADTVARAIIFHHTDIIHTRADPRVRHIDAAPAEPVCHLHGLHRQRRVGLDVEIKVVHVTCLVGGKEHARARAAPLQLHHTALLVPLITTALTLGTTRAAHTTDEGRQVPGLQRRGAVQGEQVHSAVVVTHQQQGCVWALQGSVRCEGNVG